LLAGLPEVTNVNFDQLLEPGNLKVPLSGQAISPASRFNFSLHFLFHHLHYLLRRPAGVEVKVGAEIGPVIEGLDNADWAPSHVESLNNRKKAFHGFGYSSALGGNCVTARLFEFSHIPCGGHLLKHGERPKVDVMSVGQRDELGELFGAYGRNLLEIRLKMIEVGCDS